MQRILAQSPQATQSYHLASNLQQHFTTGLEKIAQILGSQQRFASVEWLRDGGVHGGGTRLETADGDLFCRGSVNVSQVHYDDKRGRTKLTNCINFVFIKTDPIIHA